MKRRGSLLLLLVLAAVVVALVRVLRGGPAPAFDTSDTGAGPTPPDRLPAPDLASRPAPADTVAWVEPDGARCPDGFPVKAKLSSGIFHVPGGLSYDRTVPDRCYPDADAARADGLRPAKR